MPTTASPGARASPTSTAVDFDDTSVRLLSALITSQVAMAPSQVASTSSRLSQPAPTPVVPWRSSVAIGEATTSARFWRSALE